MGVKLFEVSFPKLDGSVLLWKTFWEQFDATIQCNTRLNCTKKLMYLQDVVKNGSARVIVIQVLNQTSESYEEAIRCLKEWYICLQFFQEEHIGTIVDVVHVKNDSNKELHHLYDAAIPHYRALKAAKNDSFEAVLNVILQQKLDEQTQLKWVEFNSDSEN